MRLLHGNPHLLSPVKIWEFNFPYHLSYVCYPSSLISLHIISCHYVLSYLISHYLLSYFQTFSVTIQYRICRKNISVSYLNVARTDVMRVCGLKFQTRLVGKIPMDTQCTPQCTADAHLMHAWHTPSAHLMYRYINLYVLKRHTCYMHHTW